MPDIDAHVSPEILGTAETAFPSADELLSTGNRDLFAMDTADEDWELDDYEDTAQLAPNTPQQSQSEKRIRTKYGAKMIQVRGTPEHILRAKAAEEAKGNRKRYFRDKFDLSGRYGTKNG